MIEHAAVKIKAAKNINHIKYPFKETDGNAARFNFLIKYQVIDRC